MKKLMKEVVGATVMTGMITAMSLVALEAQIVTAATATDEVLVNQPVTTTITISSPSDITLTALNGSGQNKSVGTTTWTVTTNNQAGWTLAVASSLSPAMQDVSTSKSFANYTGSGAGWTSPSNAFEFGISAHGSKTTGFGTVGAGGCNSGTADVHSTTLIWKALTTGGVQVASSSVKTATTGVATNVCYGTEQNGVFADSGSYVATTTATATTV